MFVDPPLPVAYVPRCQMSRRRRKRENRSPSPPRQHQPVDPAQKYKTEMCNKLPDCPYGNKCTFAHTEEELRSVDRGPAYKTVRCKNYERTGSCSYGHRCRFIHRDDGAPAYRWKTPTIPLRKASNEEALYVWTSWAVKCKSPPAPLKESRLINTWTKDPPSMSPVVDDDGDAR